MALGKAINKKSFYGGMATGEAPDIAMPPLDEVAPIHTAAPDPWTNTQQQSSNDGISPVPDEVPQETEQELSAASDQEETQQEPEVHAQPRAEKESSTAANMKALREAREKAERERDELLRLFQMQHIQQQQRPPDPHVHDEEPDEQDYPDIELDPEALVDGKYVNQLSKQQKQYRKEMQQMRKELNNYKSQSSEALVESRIKAQFPDFDKVVSRENVDVLNEAYPELARTLRDTTDTYAKAVSAYKVIKQFGIHKEEVPVDQDRARAIRNANKPRPLASVNPQQGDSPLSKANAFANGELTSDMKEQLRREMYQAMKNH
jgi:hypothetical protein